MDKPKFYDGTKLLSMQDIDGNKPEIYLVSTNRSGGKTTYFSRMLLNRYIKRGEKFMLLYRWGYELDGVHDVFFRDIGSLFFDGHTMTSNTKSKGLYAELLFDEKPCGYAVAINGADNLRKVSHVFTDASAMFLDEFQLESGRYVPREVQKLLSIHTSVARGQGKQSRYVPLYMCANPVSLLNPYYGALGISERLTKKTKFLRGTGWVLEQGFNESAARAQTESAFNRAFANEKYVTYAAQGVYLDDNAAFIERPQGLSRYICTLRADGADYGIREYRDLGIIYADTTADASYPIRISATTADHNINYVMLKTGEPLISHMRYLFEHGAFRFRNLKAKSAVLKAISY